MGGITPERRIFMQTQDHSDIGPDVVRFLQLLLREVPGKLLVIWDRAAIHRCQAVKDFLAKGGAKRVHLERLPAYAPELNPQKSRPPGNSSRSSPGFLLCYIYSQRRGRPMRYSGQYDRFEHFLVPWWKLVGVVDCAARGSMW
jgi:hypothetical protein